MGFWRPTFARESGQDGEDQWSLHHPPPVEPPSGRPSDVSSLIWDSHVPGLSLSVWSPSLQGPPSDDLHYTSIVFDSRSQDSKADRIPSETPVYSVVKKT